MGYDSEPLNYIVLYVVSTSWTVVIYVPIILELILLDLRGLLSPQVVKVLVDGKQLGLILKQ